MGGTIVRIPWYLAALGAALVWGLHYPLIGYALKRVSIVSVLCLTAIPVLLLMPFFGKTLAADLAAWRALAWPARTAVLALSITSTLGALLLFLSIAGKNATLAALIEISYPAFVVLFAWLLFRDVQINASIIVGGTLVFAGVFLIIWNNP